MNMASRLAEDTEQFANAKFFSILAYKGQIVGSGVNSSKSHPNGAKWGRNPDSIYMHSEVKTIYTASKRIELKDFRKTTLYIARFKKPFKNAAYCNGMAKPCTGCEACIRQFGIKKVIYTTDDGYFEELEL